MSSDDDRLLDDLRRALASGQPASDEKVAEFRRRAEAYLGGAGPGPLGSNGRAVAASTRNWWVGAVAAAAVVVVVLFVALRPAGTVEFDGLMTSPTEEATAEVTVVALGIGRRVTLTTDELAILPTGDYYELWFVAPDDTPASLNRISAGTFHPDEDGRSDIRFVAAVDPSLYPRIEVTAEPGDGDPAPTVQVVLQAEIPGLGDR